MKPTRTKKLLPLTLLALANPALAIGAEPGFSLSIEGNYGRHAGPSIDAGSYAPSLADRPWTNGETDITEIAGGTAKGVWTFVAGQQGRAFQLGLAYTGWEGRDRISAPAYGAVFFEPNPAGGNPSGVITICSPETTCTDYKSRAEREYWELMPELHMQLGESYWLGLKPFWGDLEESSYASSSLAGGRRVDNALDGEVRGILLSGKRNVALNEKLDVTLSAALGPYEIDVDSRSEGSAGGVVTDSKSIHGVRAQLGITGSLLLSQHLSLDASMLFDYWSKQPFYTGGLTGDWGGQAVCTRTMPDNVLACIPPRAAGSYDISTDSTKDFLLGLGFTYRF